ncbi:YbjN domain-containing protein [uncultured Tolumonas sp.]|uniref:YbjN domain-containing protein n=1 Tax=uncultured Tolumonas sp. TaxID=263765 RepID=UPI002A0A7AB5|nr:YbjN domain-containing protein [uncultured Tolumonas sp.]
MKNPEVLLYEEVNSEKLLSILNQAYISGHLDDDGDIVADVDGHTILLTLNKRNKLIKFTALYSLKDSFPLELKHSLTNLMNDDVILSRFSVPDIDANVLVSDYFLPYEAGVLEQNIISSLRMMSRINSHAIRYCDPQDIIN